MEVGPFSQDVLTRIINVHWAGGTVFIVVAGGNPYYVSVTGKNEETGKVDATVQPITLPDSPKGPVDSVFATSCTSIDGVPTFLLCGFVYYHEGAVEVGGGAAAVIMTSNDGLAWRHTFISETGVDIVNGQSYPIISTPNALAWSNDAFYFDQRVSRTGLGTVDTPTGPTAWFHEQIFRSANGTSWTGPVSDEQVWYGAETKEYRSAFPPAYCMHNDCIDQLGQHLPDGFMHADATANILMRPKTPATIKYGIPDIEYGDSPIVEIVPTGMPPLERVPDVGPVSNVAGAGGIWMAGGDSLSVSFDDGETWGAVEGIFGIASISAAAVSKAS